MNEKYAPIFMFGGRPRAAFSSGLALVMLSYVCLLGAASPLPKLSDLTDPPPFFPLTVPRPLPTVYFLSIFRSTYMPTTRCRSSPRSGSSMRISLSSTSSELSYPPQHVFTTERLSPCAAENVDVLSPASNTHIIVYRQKKCAHFELAVLLSKRHN